MKIKTYRKLFILTALTLIACTVTASAQPGRNSCEPVSRDPMHRCGPHFFGDQDFFKKRLNLNNDQLIEIEGLNRTYREKYLTSSDIMKKLREELRSELRHEELDLKKIRSILEQISKVELGLRMLRIEHRYHLEKILTPSQREDLRSRRLKKNGRNRR